MSNDPVSKIITATVDGFVKDGKMFTAFDVTTKIRSMGVYCKHNAVKADIHSAMADVIDDGSEGYEKTLADVDATNRAFVYHKSTDDPHTYYQSTDSSATTPATPVAPKTVVAPTPKLQGTPLNRDKRGRVCLPADMLRDIGATVGKKVEIAPQSGKISVSTYNHVNPLSSKNSHVYKVDRDNNVRISASVLEKAKISQIALINACQDNGVITVW
jgi:hypothetical protein